MLAHGAYRPEADSVAIPILNSMVAWLFWGPILSVWFFVVFRRLRPPFRMLAWDRKRSWKSWLVSVGCSFPVLLLMYEVFDAVAWKNYVEILYTGWWVVVWLLVRAALLTEKEASRKRSSGIVNPVGPR